MIIIILINNWPQILIINGKQNKNTDKGDLGDQYVRNSAKYRSLLKQQGVRKLHRSQVLLNVNSHLEIVLGKIWITNPDHQITNIPF